MTHPDPTNTAEADSLAAICAELRDRTKWFVHVGDKWKERIADRIERLDADMRESHAVTCGYYDGIISLREKDIADLRAQLAQARERLAELEGRK